MAKKTTTKAAKPTRVELARSYLAALDRGRRGYAKADDCLEQLIAAGLKPGVEVRLPDGRRLELEDPFVDKQGKARLKQFKPCGFPRYHVKVHEPDD